MNYKEIGAMPNNNGPMLDKMLLENERKLRFSETSVLVRQLEKLQEKYNILEKDFNELTDHHQKFLKSLSWRITSPMRFAKAVLKRLLRK